MKKSMALILVMILTLSLFAGCSSGADPSEVSTGDSAGSADSAAGGDSTEAPPPASDRSDEILTVALITEPAQIVPNIVFMGNEVSLICNLIYEPLIASDHRTIAPKDNALVTTDMIDDTHVRLTLRQGVKFHNGEEFTTEDVQYMFEEGKKGGHAGDRYNFFEPSEFVIEDDYNIVLALVQPWAQALEMMSFNEMMVISKTELEAIGGAGKTQQYIENAGTGKYIYKEWVPGEYILIERNEDYWDQDNLGYFAGYKFVFITDTNARGMAAQSGDVDIATEVSLASYPVYEADSNVKTVLHEVGNVYTLFLNSANEGPLQDVRVREAVSLLIDKEAIRSVGASGFGVICQTIISPEGAMYDGKDTPDIVDVDRANELLAEAGYGDGFTLRLRASADSEVSTMIQEQLRQGGIEVDIVLAERAVHFAALGEGDFDMYVSSQQYAYYTEPVRCTDGLTYGFDDVFGGCGYQNEEYTAIAQRCYAAIDIDERKAAYADLQEHFRENFVSIGLYSVTSLSVVRPDLEGFELRGVGTINLENLYSTAS